MGRARSQAELTPDLSYQAGGSATRSPARGRDCSSNSLPPTDVSSAPQHVRTCITALENTISHPFEALIKGCPVSLPLHPSILTASGFHTAPSPLSPFKRPNQTLEQTKSTRSDLSESTGRAVSLRSKPSKGLDPCGAGALHCSDGVCESRVRHVDRPGVGYIRQIEPRLGSPFCSIDLHL